MSKSKIVLVGAGSRSFGPSMINDIILSDGLCQAGVELALMDVDPGALSEMQTFAQKNIRTKERDIKVTAFQDLSKALAKADFVICAVERNRYLYWSQDYHIPRKYGFNQPYGENGGPGGAFHGLRNFPLVVEIAKTMEHICPNGILLNFSNPESRIIDAVCALTKIRAYGFCHGVMMGEDHVADFLERPKSEFEFVVGGINHFTWFLKITDKKTGNDLYPALREADRRIAPAYDWRRVGLCRVLLRRFGLWPSPGTDHCGEYIGWAHEFVDNSLEYIYDPESEPDKTVTQAPQFIYLGFQKTGPDPTSQKYFTANKRPLPTEITPSCELAIPLMESILLGKERRLESLIVPNRGYIPNLPDGQGVEVPVRVSGEGVDPLCVGPLPEAVAALCRLQLSIQKLILEAYIEKSKAKLIQAILLEPTVNSYKSAIGMINEFLERQKDVLPELH